MSQFIEMFKGDFPKLSWEECLTILNGKKYDDDYQESGTYPICGSGGIMGYGERMLCPKDTVILGRKGNINSPIYMETDYWIVDTAFCLDVDRTKLHPKYFYFWCKLFDFTRYNKQGVLPSLTKNDLLKIEMPIPPMELQTKFVDIIEQSDKSGFDGRKSQFIEMFKDKKTNGKITDLVDTDIKSVKKSFNKDDLIEYIDISSVNAKSRTLNETTQYIVSSAPSRAQQCVQNGDILVSTVRPINRNVAVVDRDLTNLVASTGFCVLRPKDGYREYLLSIVTSDRYTEKMCDIASGGLYPAVNNNDVLSYDIFIPEKDFLNRVTQIYRQADKSGSVLQYRIAC